jgi:hypothetical protein
MLPFALTPNTYFDVLIETIFFAATATMVALAGIPWALRGEHVLYKMSAVMAICLGIVATALMSFPSEPNAVQSACAFLAASPRDVRGRLSSKDRANVERYCGAMP